MCDIKLTNISNNEIVNSTMPDKNMNVYELNKKSKNARQRSFIFYQINNFEMKNYSSVQNIKIHFYLQLRIPLMHRHFFKLLSQNPDYVQAHCIDRNNPIQFACRKWYLYNNPQC